MKGDDMMDEKFDPMSGQITFTLVALGLATSAALDLFRYRPMDTYYTAFDAFSTTNWWKYSNLL
jgi:hypothetical protein